MAISAPSGVIASKKTSTPKRRRGASSSPATSKFAYQTGVNALSIAGSSTAASAIFANRAKQGKATKVPYLNLDFRVAGALGALAYLYKYPKTKRADLISNASYGALSSWGADYGYAQGAEYADKSTASAGQGKASDQAQIPEAAESSAVKGILVGEIADGDDGVGDDGVGGVKRLRRRDNKLGSKLERLKAQRAELLAELSGEDDDY